jgi:hypothetical protein
LAGLEDPKRGRLFTQDLDVSLNCLHIDPQEASKGLLADLGPAISLKPKQCQPQDSGRGWQARKGLVDELVETADLRDAPIAFQGRLAAGGAANNLGSAGLAARLVCRLGSNRATELRFHGEILGGLVVPVR